MNRYFRYILLVTFIIAVLIIVLLQFNSNRSINELVNGNENLLEELRLKANLQQLQTGIVTLESKVRGTVIAGEPIDSNHLNQETRSIELYLDRISNLEADSTMSPLLSDLDTLVNKKIKYNQNILIEFITNGKSSAEKLINTEYSKNLTRAIKVKSDQLDGIHQAKVTALIDEADNNGRKAKTFGTILALIATIAAVSAFVYATLRVRQQQLLISQLNDSEKRAKEAVRIKENFLANMSHEIRTPLNAIIGFTNLLSRKENLDDIAKEYAETIQKSGQNLLAIINDILDLSKIEAGMMRIETAPFSIRGLMYSVEKLFKPKMDEKQLGFFTHVDESIPDTLEGDATRLTQILVNLVGNSLKFTNAGSITVHLINQGINGNQLDTGILVSDTGIGIKKEKLGHIFDRFQQAEDSVTRKYGGSGLGLSIVRDLVNIQHGTIEVASEPNKGTSFRLSIPLIIAAEQISVPEPINSKELHRHPVPDGHNILVVEDNEINQALISHLLTTWHFNFEIANNGREAIQLLQKKAFDLILMDIQMPVMDGYTASAEIRNIHKLSTPIIAMTAHAMPGEREKCLSYGMNDYISKPINEDQLREIIQQYTKEKAGFKFINLNYMKEISMGSVDYEKDVTGLFINTIPGDLEALEKAWADRDIPYIRQLAHDMKTSVSVMGLNKKLKPFLDALEEGNLDEESFRKNYSSLSAICMASLEEARQFYQTLAEGN